MCTKSDALFHLDENENCMKEVFKIYCLNGVTDAAVVCLEQRKIHTGRCRHSLIPVFKWKEIWQGNTNTSLIK